MSLRADALACGRAGGRLRLLRRRRGLRRGGLDVGLLLTGSALALHVDAAAEVRAFGDRHVRDAKLDALPGFLKTRFPQTDGSVDGILCWDIIDYMDRPAAQELANQLTRVLRPEGALLGFFGTAQARDARYTKYIIVDEMTLKHRWYPAARGRQAILLNRDIIRLFHGLRVSDSFLLQNNLREILFRKPA